MKTSNKFVIEGTLVSVVIETASEVKGDKEFQPVTLWEGSFDAKDIPDLLTDGDGVKSLAAYGLASLLQDRAASYTDKALAEMGADAQARAERYKDVYAMLKDGVFSDRKKGAGASNAIDPFLAQALSEWVTSKGKTIDAGTATAMLQGMAKDARDALKSHEELKPIYDKVRADAKAAASAIDLGALLAGIQ